MRRVKAQFVTPARLTAAAYQPTRWPTGAAAAAANARAVLDGETPVMEKKRQRMR